MDYWLLRKYLMFSDSGPCSYAFNSVSSAIVFRDEAARSDVRNFSTWVRLWYCQLRFGHTTGSWSHCASFSNFFAIFWTCDKRCGRSESYTCGNDLYMFQSKNQNPSLTYFGFIVAIFIFIHGCTSCYIIYFIHKTHVDKKPQDTTDERYENLIYNQFNFIIQVDFEYFSYLALIGCMIGLRWDFFGLHTSLA